MSSFENKRISQTTFDETVKENIEDLEMEKGEAIADAIQQFKSQGVNLTNIDTSGVDRKEQRNALQEALTTLNSHKDTIRGGGTVDATATLAALQVCRDAVALVGASTADLDLEEGPADHPFSNDDVRADFPAGDPFAPEGNATTPPAIEPEEGEEKQAVNPSLRVNRSLIAMHKGPEAIAAHLRAPGATAEVVKDALDTLCLVCHDSLENKDAYPTWGMLSLSQLLAEASEPGATDPVLAQKAAKTVAVLCTRAEKLKGAFVKKEVMGIPALHRVLQECNDQPAVVRDACSALRSVTVFDDMRSDFSGAYDSARAAVDAGFVRVLLSAAERFQDREDVLGGILAALKCLACNDDSVQQISAGGGLTMVTSILTSHPQSSLICRRAAAVMRNLAGNDDVKTTMCNSEALPMLLTAINTHSTDGYLADHVLATLAAMALRRPDNCERIVGSGGVRAITLSMRRFPKMTPVQRQGCLAVRNIVGRCPELRESLLEESMEELLRKAGTLPGSVDAAYGALRDLRLECEIITMNEKGEVQVGVEQFGQVKSAFRAVYDENDNIEQAVQAAAASPAALGFNMN